MPADDPAQRSREALGHCAPNGGETLLLRAALVTSDADARTAWERWSTTHQVRTVHWRSHSLLALVADRLGPEVIGPEAAEFAHLLRRRAWTNNRLDLHSLATTLEVLAAVMPPPLVVKGASLIEDVYAPGLRTMGDADVIVGVDHFDAALGALRAARWEPTERLSDADYSRAVPLRSPSGRAIDLHRWVLYPRYSRASEAGLWERSSEVHHSGHRARHLGPADAVVVAILHGLDPREASAVRWPADVSMLARHVGPEASAEAELWSRVAHSAVELGVGRLVGAALCWCRDEFDLTVPDNTLDQLARQRPDLRLEFEWRVKRRGLPVFARVRHYVDGSRAVGRRPTPAGYARTRLGLLEELGGPKAFAVQRLTRARSTVDRLRDNKVRNP